MRNSFTQLLTMFENWIAAHPRHMLFISGGLVVITIFSIVGVSKLSSNKPFILTDLPAVESPAATKSEWKFISRQQIGRDYCDTYQKYTAYQVRCYTQNDSGKWILKDIY